MVEKIKQVKDQILQHMERELTKYGGDRIDVKQMGELADIVKDLAQAEELCWQAEYYRSVSEAMENNSSGYGMMSNARRGYGGSPANGNGMMNHVDPFSTIRDMLATANPELRAQIRNELTSLTSM